MHLTVFIGILLRLGYTVKFFKLAGRAKRQPRKCIVSMCRQAVYV